MKKKYLTTGQILGAGVFVTLLMVTIVILRSVSSFKEDEPDLDKEMQEWKQANRGKEKDEKRYKQRSVSNSENNKTALQSENIVKTKPFRFDPNAATEQEFLNLGLNERVARAIINYRAKGGVFYKKEDFAKIYNLSQQDFERLLPYIKIDKEKLPSKFSSNDKSFSKKEEYLQKSENSNNYYNNYTKKLNQAINVNKATAQDLRTLKGIGEVYSNKIIQHRERLGGFVNPEQIKEIYGFPDSLFMAIKDLLIIDTSMIKKININTAEEEEFLKHPYLKKIGKYVISYRRDLGNFKKIEDFKQVPLINEEIYRKIVPYLTL
ncbi:MAG TPA: helix-hairpin-helix domain-containing protein [Edaphocola sp.]|nr:helix-hairpin-helix domain-containing protein [Edaphocola sp.]